MLESGDARGAFDPPRGSRESVLADTAPAALQRQTFVLEFGGGTDERYFGHPIRIAPFSAAAYSDALAGREDEVKQAAVHTVSSIYRGVNVDIQLSDPAAPAPAGPASRVYFTTPGIYQFGGTNFAGGQVRYIDFGNRDPEDVAIVSTRKFSGTDARLLGRRLGQLAAHEIGHLLGLVHQQDGLMSYNASTDLIPGPVGGFFGFSDPTNSSMFPPSPRLIQSTGEYLAAILGPVDAAPDRGSRFDATLMKRRSRK